MGSATGASFWFGCRLVFVVACGRGRVLNRRVDQSLWGAEKEGLFELSFLGKWSLRRRTSPLRDDLVGGVVWFSHL